MGFLNKNEKEPTFSEAIESRRTIYNLEKSISISDEELEEIISHAVKHVPSAFNSQSTRIVLLLNDKNEKFWEDGIFKWKWHEKWQKVVEQNGEYIVQ